MRLIIFLSLFLVFAPFYTKAEIEVQNFNDYVREKQKPNAHINRSEDKITPNSTNPAGYAVSVIVLSGCWLFIMLYLKKKYFTPYTKTNDDGDFCIEALTPVEVSAIVNINRFSIYDIIMVLVDLVGRNALAAYILDDGSMAIRKGANSKDISNYEDFLIKWFIDKIGGGEYFSFKKLSSYTALNSRAIEFGIDMDIWEDELLDSVGFDIIDDKTERCKHIMAIIGLIYGLIGILIFYLTNSYFSLSLFVLMFLSYKVPQGVTRRTQEAETYYRNLMTYKNSLDLSTDSSGMPDKYLVYGIPLDIEHFIFERWDNYKALYDEAETALIEAKALADKLIRNSPLNKLKY